MGLVNTVARGEALILLAGFFLVVVAQLLAGRISLNGLTDGDCRDGSTYRSAGRVQLLFFTLMAAGYYLVQIIDNPRAFPQIPNEWLYVLFGSQATYLGGKASALLPLFRKDDSQRREP